MRSNSFIFLLLVLQLSTICCLTLQHLQQRVSKSFSKLISPYLDDAVVAADGTQHFVPLINFDQLAQRSRQTASFYAKTAAGDANCDATGCIASSTTAINANLQTGSTFDFEFTASTALVPARIRLSIPYFFVTHKLDYYYSQPRHRVGVYLANDDDTDAYQKCTSLCTTSALDNVGRSLDCSVMPVTPRREYSSIVLGELGDKLQCGHWTADDLKLCQSRTVETSARSSLNFFKISESKYFNTSFCVAVEGSESRCMDYVGSAVDFPIVLEDDIGNYRLTVNTISNYDTSIIGVDFISLTTYPADVLPSTANLAVDSWYTSNSIPPFGVLPASGIGTVQKRYLDYTGNRSNDVYAAQTLRGLKAEWTLSSCDDNQASTRSSMVNFQFSDDVLQQNDDDTSRLRLLAAATPAGAMARLRNNVYVNRNAIMLRPRAACLVPIIIAAIAGAVVAGAVIGALAIVAAQNACCTNIAGEVDNHLFELTKFMYEANNRYRTKGPSFPRSITFNSGIPNDQHITFNTVTDTQFAGVLEVKGVDLVWAAGAGVVTSWTFDKLRLFANSGGSYMELTVSVEGDFTYVQLFSDTLTLAQSRVKFEYGTTTQSIAVFPLDSFSPVFDVCLNDRSSCQSPLDVNVDQGPIGGENNGGSDGAIGTQGQNFIDLLFSSWSFALTAILYIILGIVAAIFCIVFLFKYSKKFVLFLFACSCFKGSNAGTLVSWHDQDLQYAMLQYLPSFPDSTCYCVNVTTLTSGGWYGAYTQQRLMNGFIDYHYWNLQTTAGSFPNAATVIKTPGFYSFTTANFQSTYKQYSVSDSVDGFIAGIESCASSDKFMVTSFGDQWLWFQPVAVVANRQYLYCTRSASQTDLYSTMHYVEEKAISIPFESKFITILVFFYFSNYVVPNADVESVFNQENVGTRYSDANILMSSTLSPVTTFRTQLALFNCPHCGPIYDMELVRLALQGSNLYIRDTAYRLELTPVVDGSKPQITAQCYLSGAPPFYCNGTNFDIISTHNLQASFRTVVVALNTFTFPLDIFETTVGFNIITQCTGTVVFDSYGQLICDATCCIVTDDDFRTVKYIAGGQVVPNTFRSASRTLTYVNDHEQFNAPLNTAEDSCSVASLASSWDCFLFEYAEIFWLVIAFVSLALFFVLIHLIRKGCVRVIYGAAASGVFKTRNTYKKYSSRKSKNY